MRRQTPGRSREDRRVQKTQEVLHLALASLIREQGYDSITVQAILRRANVGRSTFYMHFRDKEDLLVSGVQKMLHSACDQARSSSRGNQDVLAFSLPMLEHVHAHRLDRSAAVGPEVWRVVHRHIRNVIAEMIADEVNSLSRRRRKGSTPIPADLLVEHIAATFILVLTWWAKGRCRLAPKEADALFRSLIPSI